MGRGLRKLRPTLATRFLVYLRQKAAVPPLLSCVYVCTPLLRSFGALASNSIKSLHPRNEDRFTTVFVLPLASVLDSYLTPILGHPCLLRLSSKEWTNVTFAMEKTGAIVQCVWYQSVVCRAANQTIVEYAAAAVAERIQNTAAAVGDVV